LRETHLPATLRQHHEAKDRAIVVTARTAEPPPGGLTADAVAELWHRLMSDGLGYSRYAAHGSDLGAGVIARLTRAHPEAVVGIHLATPGLARPTPTTDTCRRSALRCGRRLDRRGRRPRPPTGHEALDPGCRPADSPAGLAAWIGEKSWFGAAPPTRTASLRPRPAAGHPHPLLDHRHHHLLHAALPGLPPQPRQQETHPRSPPRSASSAASVSRFPSRPTSSPSATSL
jgi:hypothetical protein